MLAVLLSGAACLIFLVMAKIMHERKAEQENDMLQSYLTSMQESYEQIQSKADALRKYRHDLAKHIQTLEAMAEESGRFGRGEIARAVLKVKKRQCAEKSIPVRMQAEDCEYGGIEAPDMASLLQNLLDNAIEANERIRGDQERGIWFSMRKDKKHILIEIENHFPKGEKIDFCTRKASSKEHGVGTKIIDGLIKKYHGSRTYEADEKRGIFKDRIMLSEERRRAVRRHYELICSQASGLEREQKEISRRMEELILLRSENTPGGQAGEYIRSLTGKYESIQAGVYCRDIAVDAMLYYMACGCRKRGIDFTFSFQEYDRGAVSQNDIVKILSVICERAFMEKAERLRLRAGNVKKRFILEILWGGGRKIRRLDG